jgi:spore coat protein CotF
MGNVISSILGSTTQLDDKAIANDMLMGAKGAAGAYLAATLECATPELRALYSTGLTQLVEGHAALTNLALNKKWYTPYETPEKQLSCIFRESEELKRCQNSTLLCEGMRHTDWQTLLSSGVIINSQVI